MEKLQEAGDAMVQLIESSSNTYKALSSVHSTTQSRADAYNPKIRRKKGRKIRKVKLKVTLS